MREESTSFTGMILGHLRMKVNRIYLHEGCRFTSCRYCLRGSRFYWPSIGPEESSQRQISFI